MGKVILKIDLFLRRGEEEEGGKGGEGEEEEVRVRANNSLTCTLD